MPGAVLSTSSPRARPRAPSRAPSGAAPPRPGPAAHSPTGREDAESHKGPRAGHKTAFRVSRKSQFNVFSNKTKGRHLVPFIKTSSGSENKAASERSWLWVISTRGVAWTQSPRHGDRAAGSRCRPGFCFCFTEAELGGWGAPGGFGLSPSSGPEEEGGLPALLTSPSTFSIWGSKGQL